MTSPADRREGPPRLRELQAFLAVALRSDTPIPEDATADAAARLHVAGNDRLTPAEQADLYREQFWLRHLASLEEDFPGLRALVGVDVFDALARDYLKASPPRTPSLRDLAADLEAFAATWPGWAEPSRGAALEMLAYEKRFSDVFDGRDPPPLDAAKLQAIGEDAWERAHIALHPLLARLRLRWAVHLYRLAALDAAEPPPFPEPRAVCLVLYRKANVIHYDELEPAAFELLEALGRGEALGAACEGVARSLPADEGEALSLGETPKAPLEAFGAKVGPWFADWTAKGWIVDVNV